MNDKNGRKYQCQNNKFLAKIIFLLKEKSGIKTRKRKNKKIYLKK